MSLDFANFIKSGKAVKKNPGNPIIVTILQKLYILPNIVESLHLCFTRQTCNYQQVHTCSSRILPAKSQGMAGDCGEGSARDQASLVKV